MQKEKYILIEKQKTKAMSGLSKASMIEILSHFPRQTLRNLARETGTPIGFQKENTIGNLVLAMSNGNINLNLQLSR